MSGPVGLEPDDQAASVADAPKGNWVDRWAPKAARPYLRLARADRPIGVWLLLWPCWWSVALAGRAAGHSIPDVRLLILFAIGSLAMRAAGCTYNDIVDRDFDAKVARTRSRPIPSGQVSLTEALIFLGALCLIGFVVLLQFNQFAILLGISSLVLVAIYPFMKRVTWWPQAFLGLTFNWGALMGWAAIFAALGLPALLLYGAAIAWTIGYDTIYAHQDKEDDALLGLRSTALLFGGKTKLWLALFYGAAIALLAGAGIAAGASVPFLMGVLAAAIQMTWQVVTLDIGDAENCLNRFRTNRDIGMIVFVALVADLMLAG